MRQHQCFPPSTLLSYFLYCSARAPGRPTATITMRCIPIEAATSRRVTLKRVDPPQGGTSLGSDLVTVSAILTLRRAFGTRAAIVRTSSLLEIAFLDENAPAVFCGPCGVRILLEFEVERRGCVFLSGKWSEIDCWRCTYKCLPHPQIQQ